MKNTEQTLHQLEHKEFFKVEKMKHSDIKELKELKELNKSVVVC